MTENTKEIPMADSHPAPHSLRELILQATARGWCSPENSSKVMDPDLAQAIASEVEKAVDEHYALKFAAIMTASIQNTPESAKERIGPDNPYWTVAYGDVCTAVDREMKLLAATPNRHADLVNLLWEYSNRPQVDGELMSLLRQAADALERHEQR